VPISAESFRRVVLAALTSRYFLFPLFHSSHFLVLAIDAGAADRTPRKPVSVRVFDSMANYCVATRNDLVRAVLEEFAKLVSSDSDAAKCLEDEMKKLVEYPSSAGIQGRRTNDCGLFTIQNALLAVREWFPTEFAADPLPNFTDGSPDVAEGTTGGERHELVKWFQRRDTGITDTPMTKIPQREPTTDPKHITAEVGDSPAHAVLALKKVTPARRQREVENAQARSTSEASTEDGEQTDYEDLLFDLAN
jgi:hypothetical protein